MLVGEGRVTFCQVLSALNQISAGVSAVDKQNELMGFKIQRVENKRVDQFENMSDDELRQYIYGNKELHGQ